MTELLRVARVDKTFVAPPRFGDGLLRLIGRAPRRAVLRAVSDVSLTGVGRAGILLVDSADVTVTGFDIQTPGNFGIGAFNVSGLAIGDGLIDGAGSVAPRSGRASTSVTCMTSPSSS